MTSAPVKDVNSLMNFVGGRNLTKTGGMTQMQSFGDVMSRTRGNGAGAQSQNIAGSQRGGKPAADAMKGRREITGTDKSAVRQTEAKELTPEQEQALEQAGKEVLEKVAEELEVSPEEVERAMEELGLSLYSLFDPSNLTQLVLQVSGGQDASALLTDESLFAGLQDLLSQAEQIGAQLSEELGVAPEDLQSVLDAVKAGKEMSGEDMEAVSGEQTGDIRDISLRQRAEEESLSKITVEVKTGGKEIELTADEKGNVTGAPQTMQSGEEAGAADTDAGSHKENGKRGQQESMTYTGNHMVEGMLQDKMQAAEVTFEQTASFFSEQTRDIMDQIMNYMKIQLRPGMDQLEMQLHPASLGTVHIQITNRGGEVTAQFQVQNETVKQAIESQLQTLQESLREQGVKVQAVQVTVENHGFESNLWQGQGREQNASSQNNGRRTPRRINLNDLDGIALEEADEEEQLAAKMMEANGNTVDYTA